MGVAASRTRSPACRARRCGAGGGDEDLTAAGQGDQAGLVTGPGWLTCRLDCAGPASCGGRSSEPRGPQPPPVPLRPAGRRADEHRVPGQRPCLRLASHFPSLGGWTFAQVAFLYGMRQVASAICSRAATGGPRGSLWPAPAHDPGGVELVIPWVIRCRRPRACVATTRHQPRDTG